MKLKGPIRKISETLLEFSAPLLEVLPEGAGEPEIRRVLMVGVTVWNAVNVADTGRDVLPLEQVLEVARTHSSEGALIEMLVERKRGQFGDDRRLIGNWGFRHPAGRLVLWAEVRGRKDSQARE